MGFTLEDRILLCEECPEWPLEICPEHLKERDAAKIKDLEDAHNRGACGCIECEAREDGVEDAKLFLRESGLYGKNI